MSYTSLEELVFPDALGNKILINPFEPVEDSTDNRGAQVMAATTDFLAALMRGHWSVEFIPATQVSINWDYTTKTMTVSGGDLTVELMWLDINTRLATPTRIIIQQGAHLLSTFTDILVRPTVGADITIAPSATDIVTDNAFVEGGTSVADIQTTLDDIGSTDFFNQPDYVGAEAVTAMLPLMKVSGRSLSLFGGKVRIRDAYDFKLLDRDTQYVQVLDDTISSTATVGAWELTGQDNSFIAFGDNSSITMGDNASWVSGNNPLFSTGTGTTDIDVGGILDLEASGAFGHLMKFLGDLEMGVWSGVAFDASLQFTLIDTFLQESRGGDITIQNTNIASGGITLSTVQGDVNHNIALGNFLVDVFSGDITLDTSNGNIVLVTGTAGDLDVDVDELTVDLTGAGVSYIQKTAGTLLQFVTNNAGVGLEARTIADTSDLGIYTEGVSSFLDIYTTGINSDLTVETQNSNARVRIRTQAAWTSPTHPGSYVDLQSDGGINIGRIASGDIETLTDPVTALFIDQSDVVPGNGDVLGTTVGFLNTRVSDFFGERLNILRFMGYNSGDAAGVPHYQAEMRVSAADSSASEYSAWSLWLNDNTSLVEMLNVGSFTGAEEKVSVINVPLLVDADGILTTIPDPSFSWGAPVAKAAVRSTDNSGTFLSIINGELSDSVNDRKVGIAFGGYRAAGSYVDQGGIVALGQGVNDDALLRFLISNGGGNMAAFLDVTNPGGSAIYSQFFGDVQIEDLICTAQADLQDGAQFAGDLEATNASIPKAQNQIWAGAEINLNAAVTVTTTGTHAPSTTGLVRKMRTDSIIRITGSDVYEIRMTENLPDPSTALIVPVITYNVTGYTQYQAHVSSVTATYVRIIIKDAAGATVNESGLAGDLHVTFYVLRGE